MRTLQRSLLSLALALLIVIPRNIFSCGPFFEEAVFSFDKHPDFPMTDYLAGKLGVLQPGYHRLFLVAAYRNLSGHLFTPSERAALERLLTHEAEYADSIGAYGYEEPDHEMETPPPPASRAWLIERAKALGEAPPQNPDFDQNLDWANYQSFMNCPDAAFANAVQTLHDRQQKWGTNSADLKTWIAGQDVVFSHCSKRQDAMPPAIATNNKLLQQDRDYQIAAALFYSGVPDQLVQAQQRFDAIGQDKTSPWHVWGPYLAARSVIRAATLKSTDQVPLDKTLMADAEARLKKIASTPDLATTKRASEQMLGFVEARLHPDDRAQELASTLMNGTSADIRQDFIDYRYLLDNGSAEPNAETRKDDLTDWIRTFQAAGEKDHAIAKWRETKSLPWLVAAINVVDAKDAAAKDLLAAAAKLDAHDPRLLTVLYRRVVLTRGMNDDKDARSLIDANLAYLGKEAPISSRNLLWGQRMALATTFDDFLRFGGREDALQHHAQANLKPDAPVPPNTPNDVYFDTDATAVLNRALPETLLVQATNNVQLPKALQSEVAQSAFVRALLLNQPAIAAELAPAVKQATPVLGSSIDAYARATTDEDRHRAVLFALLHNPGMRPYVVPNMQRTTEMEKIDSFHDNWWCEDVGARTEVKPLDYVDGAAQAGKQSARPAPSPAWLSAADKTAGATEWESLAKLGAAPTYFGREVIAWAKAAPDDPRIPEALHLVVRATRYGCGDDKTSSYSKQAFQLLHAKYPKSEWTKKTPYFY
jgi:hypothetical protein